jgi:RND family efflux transporter MFP subunit
MNNMNPSKQSITEAHPKAIPPLVVTGRRLKILAALVFIVLIAGFLFVHHERAEHEDQIAKITKEIADAPPLVETVMVQKAPSSASLTLPGATAAWYESVIYARVDGYVGKWYADIGDHVSKGQVLAMLETPELDAELVAAQAKLKASQALVEFTKSTYERWKDSPKGVVSEQERESKKADYDRAVAQMGLDQAEVDRYTALIAFKQVTAPYDGIITERHIDIGNLVTAGSTANTTPLYRIVQDDPIRVFVDVPQSAAQSIDGNLIAHITVNNIPGRVYEGKVTRTANAINTQTRTLLVEVDIPNFDHTLVSGMYVDITFNIPNDGLLQIPAAALVFRSNGPQVAVVSRDNKINFRNVSISRDNGGNVVIASGINEGDRVALNISNQIVQGDAVMVLDQSNNGNSHVQK